MPGAGKNDRRHLRHSLIAHSAVDQPHAPGFVKAFQVIGQRARARGIVRAIQNHFRISRDVLQPARPHGLRDSLLDDFQRHSQPLQRGYGSDRIFNLVHTRQRTAYAQPTPGELAAARVERDVADLHRCAAHHLHAQIHGARRKYRVRLRALPREHRRHSRFQNARLLPRNGFQALAQKRLVIEIHRSDHAQLGHDHVGRVQAPAQPHFQHRHLHAASAKQQQRHGRHAFEVSRMQIDARLAQQSLRAGVYAIECLRKTFCGNRRTPDRNPFGRLHQVRRREQPRAQPRPPQPGFDHRAGGTLAVGSRHMHEPARPLRIS